MASSRKLQPSTILDCLEDPAAVLGEDYRILAANHAYLRTFGGGGPVKGRFCYEVFHGYAAPCPLSGEPCPLAECLESGESCRVVHVRYTPQGPHREDVITRPLVDDDGVVRSFLERIHPVSDAELETGEERLVGGGPAFARLLDLIEKVAGRNIVVLLAGEPGTGKKLVAKTIHRLGPRHDGPFVPADCSSLPQSRLASQLFGRERGSPSWLTGERRGWIEAAHGGTLFLDDVSDIAPRLQIKLLRLLESGCYWRMGGSDRQRSDFRLICATQRDLGALVDEGAFRKDLYYRISVFPIRLPPLRERLEDIPLLADCIARRLQAPEPLQLHPRTLAALRRYAFPGNVRELLNILQRAYLLAEGGIILPAHLPGKCREAEDASPSPAPAQVDGQTIMPLAEAEKRYLRRVAEHFPGDNRELAKRLGISERTLYRKLSKIRPGKSSSGDKPKSAPRKGTRDGH